MGWYLSEETVEQAKEELELLEAQHPNRFGFLKDQLRAFIAPLLHSIPAACPASTQASTTEAAGGRRRKKKKKLDGDDDDDESVDVDLVMERAHSCLAKIQHLKSLLKSHHSKSESVLIH